MIHTTNNIIAPFASIQSRAHLSSLEVYEALYRESIEDPEKFWLQMARSTLSWFTPPSLGIRYLWDAEHHQVSHTFFEDGLMNVSVNCLDRHIEAGLGAKTALLFEGEGRTASYTYRELLHAVVRAAHLLKKWGVGKGDVVSLFLPNTPELAIFMLACARLGAIHSVIFGGFSAEALAHRLCDSKTRVLISCMRSFRGGKEIPFRERIHEALIRTPSIEGVYFVEDIPLHEVPLEEALEHDKPAVLRAEDPLFLLYTSGSTGKPKAVLHTQAGYLLHAMLSHRYYFDIQEDDVYWCTADLGWITGHSYVIYAPLSNGCTTLLFEGIPTYPHGGRYWEIVEKYRATIFYTAPTAIRSLIRLGEQIPKQFDLSSLRLLGSVGEPINPEVWLWYFEHIGRSRCPVIDTYWQTETGGIIIAPLPGVHALKPGSATRPFFGVEPVILKENGEEASYGEKGALCIKRPWPGILRSTFGDHQKMVETYFTPFKDHYFTGDAAIQDEDGYFWLCGRMDDVINVSGHRIGSTEVESVLVTHPSVAEAAVVGCIDPIKGQAIAAFVTLKESAIPSPLLEEELRHLVKQAIGSIAIPRDITFTQTLPKTRSGKIMRRLLRKIANHDLDNLGDTSTLSETIEPLLRSHST